MKYSILYDPTRQYQIDVDRTRWDMMEGMVVTGEDGTEPEINGLTQTGKDMVRKEVERQRGQYCLIDQNRI